MAIPADLSQEEQGGQTTDSDRGSVETKEVRASAVDAGENNEEENSRLRNVSCANTVNVNAPLAVLSALHPNLLAQAHQPQQPAFAFAQQSSNTFDNSSLALASSEQQQLQQQLSLLQTLPQPLTTHNLIPLHLQASTLAASLHGTPGHQPALIPSLLAATRQQQQQQHALLLPPAPAQPALTVQDRPMTPPIYNGVNPNYPGLRVLNTSPPVFAVDNFLTPFECDFLINAAQDSFTPAPVVGKGVGEISPSRTSSTCYLAREDTPDLIRKVSLLTGKPADHLELPQVGRYLPSQQYLQHFDAFDLGTEDGRRFASNGGQRTITCLIYLNNVMRGGATRFPALNLDVQPRKGMALVFFPATIDGMLDKMALHAAMPAVDTKFVSQVWIRQSTYAGQPSKRLPQTLGVPFSLPPAPHAGVVGGTPHAVAAAAAAGVVAAAHHHHHHHQHHADSNNPSSNGGLLQQQASTALSTQF